MGGWRVGAGHRAPHIPAGRRTRAGSPQPSSLSAGGGDSVKAAGLARGPPESDRSGSPRPQPCAARRASCPSSPAQRRRVGRAPAADRLPLPPLLGLGLWCNGAGASEKKTKVTPLSASKSRVSATLEDPTGLASLGPPPQLTMMAAASSSHRRGSRRSRGRSSGTTAGATVRSARARRPASTGQGDKSQRSK